MFTASLRQFCFAVGVSFLFIAPVQAGECDVQSLLVRAHHLAQIFEQQRHSPEAQRTARQLRTVLDQLPPFSLQARLRAAGLSAHSSDISRFLRSQRALVSTQILRGTTLGLPAHTEQDARTFLQTMQKLVPKLHCDDGPEHRPDDAMPTTGTTTPVAIQDDGPHRVISSEEAAKVSMAAFGLIAILVAGSIALRHRANVRR
jgi:hypothetical protein